MDTSVITHPAVRSAIEAWQSRDLAGWLSRFEPDAQLLDDGQPRDFKAFSDEIGKEYFVSIDAVRRGGTEIVGHFHSDAWGDFTTYFRFTPNESGRFSRLEIGQAAG